MLMRRTALAVLFSAVQVATMVDVAGQTAAKLKDPAALTEQAPATYRARFETSQGVFVIEAHRDWAPNAADPSTTW